MTNTNNVLFACMNKHAKGNIRRFIRNLKYAKQRIIRGYADCDVWDFNVFLGGIISGGLTALAGEGHSFPERYDNAGNWKNELIRISSLTAKLSAPEDERPDNYGKIKNEVFEWLKENFDDLWD